MKRKKKQTMTQQGPPQMHSNQPHQMIKHTMPLLVSTYLDALAT